MFDNRQDAGLQLGKALEKYRAEHPLILGIPRGGIEVGYYTAKHLGSDFDAIIVRKLGYPHQPEAAFGALAEDGSLYLDPWSNKYLNREMIEEVEEREFNEINRRINSYRRGRKLPNLKNRTVILVDDGLATGATTFAALIMCRRLNPAKLVVAVPVSGVTRIAKLESMADEVFILEKRKQFFAVSEGYREFSNLTDQEVISFMDRWQKETARQIDTD